MKKQINKLIYSPIEASRILGFKLMKQKDPESYELWEYYFNMLAHSHLVKSKQHIHNMPNLKSLYIISECDILLKNLNLFKKAFNLTLYNNKLNTFPTQITEMGNLESLHIEGSDLKEIPQEIENLTKLKKLYCNDNNISKISAKIGNLQNLEKLTIISNNLTNIPDEIFNLKKLDGLNLSYNKLTDIQDKFDELPSLFSLILNNNPFKFTQIPTNIKNHKNIRHLQILNIKYNSQ